MTGVSLASTMVLAFTLVAGAQNTPPVVNAGKDTTIVIGQKFSMYGKVTDDGLPYGVVRYGWTKIAGPDTGFTLATPSSRLSGATVTGAGVFTYEFFATDSQFTARDTIVITVHQALSFVVLTPRAGETVRPGDSILVTWQMDPPSSVNVNLSTDTGLSFVYLAGPVPVLSNTGSLMWHINPALPPSSACLIEIQYYGDHAKVAYSGMFTVAPSAVRNGMHRGSAPSPDHTGDALYSLDGRRISPSIRLASEKSGVAIRLSNHVNHAALVTFIQ